MVFIYFATWDVDADVTVSLVHVADQKNKVFRKSPHFRVIMWGRMTVAREFGNI